MAIEKIIVLDDELVIRKTLQEQLRKRRYMVAAAETIAQARDLLTKDQFDLIFIDLGLPDGEGRAFLEEITQMPDAPMVVMMTGDTSIKKAVDSINKGAFDYIIKPFHIEQIEIVIKKAESFSHVVKVNEVLSHDQTQGAALVGESKAMQGLRNMVQKVASTEATVLICGENGTGKELIAHEIYAQSPLKGKPYIKVNCAAMSETLMESEFFGHEKGAFTGATHKREGRFELANGGTLLLDEISEISPRLQSKLLRVLQEKEFERVGGNKTLKVDVRVIATTNRNMVKAVEEGEFREDLFYRLNVFPINIPSLRERGDDILLLAENFLEKFTQKHARKGTTFSKEAKKALIDHPWPGNVRELQNTIERAVILTDPGEKIKDSSLGLVIRNTGGTFNDIDSIDEESLASLHEMEKTHILGALERAEGKRKQAAEMLDISLKKLQTKLEKYKEEGEEIAS